MSVFTADSPRDTVMAWIFVIVQDLNATGATSNQCQVHSAVARTGGGCPDEVTIASWSACGCDNCEGDGGGEGHTPWGMTFASDGRAA